MASPVKSSKKYKSYDDVWELDDGDILLYKRKGNARPNFQYRLKIRNANGYIIESSGTKDLLAAALIAKNRFNDLDADVRRYGANYIEKRTWADIWKEFERDVIDRKLRRNEIKPKRKTKMVGIWNNWIKPFWEKKRGVDINEPTIEEYWTWRMEQNDAPNNTLLDQAKTFTALVRFAASKGYIDAPTIKLTPDVKKEKRRRGAFTLQQVREIDVHLRKWQEASKTKDILQARRCFHTFVMFGFYSGMRIGEMLNMKWKNIQMPDVKRQRDGGLIITQGDQEIVIDEESANKISLKDAYDIANGILQIHIPDGDSKTGFRTVIPMKEATAIMENWEWVTKYKKPDDFVFPNRKGTRRTVESFEKMHRETIKTIGEDYVEDRYGNPLLPYSYRHTYATIMLIHSKDIRMEELAVNMGTSIEQIERHYSHVIPSDLQDRLSSQIIHLAKGVGT